MLAGGGNLVQVFLHLVRLIDVGGSQSGKADDRIHRSADVVGHVVEEGCFGTVGVFRRVQCVNEKFTELILLREGDADKRERQCHGEERQSRKNKLQEHERNRQQIRHKIHDALPDLCFGVQNGEKHKGVEKQGYEVQNRNGGAAVIGGGAGDLKQNAREMVQKKEQRRKQKHSKEENSNVCTRRAV